MAERLRRSKGWLDEAGLTDVCIEIARAPDHFRDAFRLLHDSYVEAGYIRPEPVGVWLQPHHCTGPVTVLVARRAGRVVGTISVFDDGPDGLPADRVYGAEVSRVRRAGRAYEIASLSLHPAERQRGLALLIQAVALHLGSRLRGGTHCLCTVPPSRIAYYETVFGFSVLRSDAEYHGFRQPAALMHLDLTTFDAWSAVYAQPASGQHNVRSLMALTKLPYTRVTGEAGVVPAEFEALLPASFSTER